MSAHAPLLEVADLSVSYRTSHGAVDAVRGVSFSVAPGETVAIVGESGSGKSTTVHALIRLLPAAAQVESGQILFEGTDLARARPVTLRSVRGRRIGFIPQDPTVSLNPVKRIGEQVAEALRIHGIADRRNAAVRAVEALAGAGLPDPELNAQRFPHELSGGMRQRVLIAIAIVADPALIIADEPTSALDVTVQRKILDHLDLLKNERGTGLLLITHDLGVAADRADRIIVMSQGEIVEQGTPLTILHDPQHPYTQQLIAAAPSLNVRGDRGVREEASLPGLDSSPQPLLQVHELVKAFGAAASRHGRPGHRAVDGVSFSVERGRTLALVGESGSGKTTSARLALRLTDASAGQILFDGTDVTAVAGARLRQLRQRMQLVQQNPYAALNPRWTVEAIVADPLGAYRRGSATDRRRRVAELIDMVALPATVLTRKPRELSGGQRQRVAIARALALSPELLVLDEPVSALDVSIQHQILELLVSLQRELALGYLFISHDLAVVRQIAHTVAVMQRGRIVEFGAVAEVFESPRAEYTRALLDAIPGTANLVPTSAPFAPPGA